MTDKRRPDGTQPGDERLMMVSPEFWTNWPLLTLKRRPQENNKTGEYALLYDRMHEGGTHDGEFRFFRNGIILFATLKEVREAPVADIDQILADGWVVD